MNRIHFVRRCRITLCALTTSALLTSFATEAAATPTPTVAAQPQSKRSGFAMGVMLDVGVPDIVGTSFVISPLYWLQLHVGATTDLAAVGIRGGVTFLPFDAFFTPSLTIEGGHVFEGNLNGLARAFGVESPMLERVGYDYGNAHLGIEIGSPRGTRFFLHGGVSYIRTTIHNMQQVVQEDAGDGSITFNDPQLTGFFPSAKLGFLIYI